MPPLFVTESGGVATALHMRHSRVSIASLLFALVFAVDLTTASAQTAPRIEQLAPELDKIMSTSEPIQTLATGFGGGGNTEGPVWWKEGGYLLFSSIGDNQVIKYTPGKGTSVFREKTNGANGHTRDMQGRRVACEGLARRVTREEPDGSFTVIAKGAGSRACEGTQQMPLIVQGPPPPPKPAAKKGEPKKAEKKAPAKKPAAKKKAPAKKDEKKKDDSSK